MRPRTLDHVALWVSDRDAIADVATARLGMHVIDRTDRFTLVGADARRGKLTLFAADGPRERGPLVHVGLRVSSLDGRDERVDLGEGLEAVLVEAPTEVEFDLDHVALASPDPVAAADAWEAYGLARVGETRLEVGGAYVDLVPGGGDGTEPERPLLNHLAVLVDSVEEHVTEARALGIEIADVVDAANTLALFVWGPDRVKLEYVEHKPSFSLV
jgi:catechol 2,3-dioxygenase-like lactoylglutathione lyase family enzyme